MAFDLLNKLKDSADNEVIGELDGKLEREKEMNAPKPKKEKKQKAPKKEKAKKPKKEKKPLFGGLFEKKEEPEYDDYEENYSQPTSSNAELVNQFQEYQQQAEDEVDPGKYIKTDVAGGRTRRMIINEFGLNDGEIIPSELPTRDDVDNVRFSISVPNGFATDEVDEFVDVMVDTVGRYRQIIVKQHETMNKLIDEILRVDRQALDQRNQEVLDSFISQGNNEREKLQNQLVDVQLAKSNLEQELKQVKAGVIPKNVDTVALEAENKELKQSLAELQSQLSSLQSNSSSDDSDTIRQELENALRTNEELAREVEEMRQTLSADDREAELLNEIARLKEENEALQSAPSQAAPKSRAAEKVVVTSEESVDKFKSLYEALDGDGDREEELLKQFANDSSRSKRSKKTLSPEDVERIKASQVEPDIETVPVVSTGDDMMDRMFAEMNE